jgi:hypothetical protein
LLSSPASFLPPGYFFNRPCGNQIGTKSLEAVCDEQGIGGSGEYCGDNNAHLGRINVFTTSPWAASALFDLEPGVIGAVILSRARRTLQPE